MISLFNKNNKISEQKNTLLITYPRTVSIIFGHYSYPDIIHNLLMDIKNNLDPKMKNFTNVKGGMTSWTHFLENPMFINFMHYLINTHQNTHPNIFEHFFEKYYVKDAWGNEILKNDSLNFHTHPFLHGILYLSKGCDLILPELNIKITPEPGDYYIFPAKILHGFDSYQGETNRYSLIFNIIEKPNKFNYTKKLDFINEKYGRKEK